MIDLLDRLDPQFRNPEYQRAPEDLFDAIMQPYLPIDNKWHSKSSSGVFSNLFFTHDHPWRRFAETTPVLIAHRGENSTLHALREASVTLRNAGFRVEEIYYAPSESLDRVAHAIDAELRGNSSTMLFLNMELGAGLGYAIGWTKQVPLSELAGQLPTIKDTQAYEGAKMWVTTLNSSVDRWSAASMLCKPDKPYQYRTIDEVLTAVRGAYLSSFSEAVYEIDTQNLTPGQRANRFCTGLAKRMDDQSSLSNIFIVTPELGEHLGFANFNDPEEKAQKESGDYSLFAKRIRENMLASGLSGPAILIVNTPIEIVEALNCSLENGTRNLYIFDRHFAKYGWTSLFGFAGLGSKSDLVNLAAEAKVENPLDQVQRWIEKFPETSGAIVFPVGEGGPGAAPGNAFSGTFSQLLGPLNPLGDIESATHIKITAADAMMVELLKMFWVNTFGSDSADPMQEVGNAIIAYVQEKIAQHLIDTCNRYGFDIGYAESLAQMCQQFLLYRKNALLPDGKSLKALLTSSIR